MYIYISLQFAQIIFVCYNGEKHATKSPWSERTLFDTSLCTPSKGYFEYGLIRMPFLKIKSVRKPIFVCCKTCMHGKHGTKTLGLRVHCSVRYQSVYATRWYDGRPWELVATRRQGFPSCPPQATRACCRLRPILGRLDRRLSGIEVLPRYLLLWQVDAGGSRWPPTSSHSSTR